MTARFAWALPLLVFGGCGDSEPAANADAQVANDPDAGDSPDASSKADAAVPAACSIAVVETSLEDWRQDTRKYLNDEGFVVINSEIQYGDTVHLSGDLGAFDDSDPGLGSLAWAAGLPDFPVPAAELEVSLVKDSSFGSRTVVIGRSKVGDVDAQFFRPAVSLLLQEDAETMDRWQVKSITVWASVTLADNTEASALADCTTDEPPPIEPLLHQPFDGLVMAGCVINGDYSYLPSSNDHFTFEDEADWVVHEGTWRVRRTGTLRIHKKNYFDGIQGADCFCPGFDDTPTTAGFYIEVDAVSGELLFFRPGIGCVVC